MESFSSRRLGDVNFIDDVRRESFGGVARQILGKNTRSGQNRAPFKLFRVQTPSNKLKYFASPPTPTAYLCTRNFGKTFSMSGFMKYSFNTSPPPTIIKFGETDGSVSSGCKKCNLKVLNSTSLPLLEIGDSSKIFANKTVKDGIKKSSPKFPLP